ncbi:uncharacterized protein J4E87_010618 [Alternaria ethzedia]|uniref:uncharacterized protein n=1 Tax=Alternaria ethzedia TaxID=181014 RepID=UPI0020C312E3|nr:uncharacterized protein J4E87_010618 [Alternaria ethzedia]KAI4611099.1 hypothetical protein J4E87_010618 [Alternaria ethzedia]
MGCCNLFRFSRRKDREKPRTSALQVAVATSDDFQEKRSEEGPKTSSTTDVQSTSTSTPELVAESLPGRLWNLAYDQLKSKDPKLIEHYEGILSSQIDGQELKAVDLNTQINKISLEQPRSLQMRQLVASGLLRTEKAAATNEAVAQGLQVFNVVKDSVATATRASPEASIAWVPICLALDILMNPLTQQSSNRDGIAYVVSRMDWYWHLADLLLERNQEARRSQPLQEQLEKNLVDLYTRLLAYQIKSIITYHRKRGTVFARDLVKWDDWEGELAAIKEMEESIRQDAAQFNTHEIRNQLQTITEKAESQDISLHNIVTSIQEQTAHSLAYTKSADDNKCLQHLFLTNPSHDKERLENAKGGLLDGSFRWILDNADYRRWRNDREERLLWVEGSPGQGKTMLMCGIIDALEQTVAAGDLISYFFCQTSEPRNNNATAVLRGLIHHLIGQQPSLVRYVRLEYDRVGEKLFNDANTWTALSKIITSMLDDTYIRQGNIYLIIDAMDECIDPDDRRRLLELIVQISRSLSHTKWIISSRGWNDIRDVLTEHPQMLHLGLDPKSEAILDAVNTYIEYKVEALATKKRLDLSDAVIIRGYLIENAGGTFLWVALVCKTLESSIGIVYKTAMQAFPPGLKELYKRMLQQIESMNGIEVKIHKLVLGVVLTAKRPLRVTELPLFVEELDDITDKVAAIEEIVLGCGSFLYLQNGTVHCVHQSAKDYLLNEGNKTVIGDSQGDFYIRVLNRISGMLHKLIKEDERMEELHIRSTGQNLWGSDGCSGETREILQHVTHYASCVRDTDLKFYIVEEGTVFQDFFHYFYTRRPSEWRDKARAEWAAQHQIQNG